MAEDIKKFTFEVEIKDADGNKKVVKEVTQSVQDYRDALKKAQEQAANAPLNSEEWKEATLRVDELTEATEQAEKASEDYLKSLKDLGDGIEDTNEKSKSMGDKLAAIPGPVGKAVQSFQGLGKAFKLIVANPVGLIIVAITTAVTALFKAFTSTKKGAEQWQQVMAALGAVLDVVRDALVKVVDVIIGAVTDFDSFYENTLVPIGDWFRDLSTVVVNQVLKGWNNLKIGLNNLRIGFNELLGDEEEAAELRARNNELINENLELTKEQEDAAKRVVKPFVEAGKAIRDMYNEATEEGKRAAELTAELQRIDDAQRELNVRRAEQNALIAEAKRAMTDETLTFEERMEAAQTAFAAEQALLDEELSLNQRRLKVLEELASMSDSSAETLQEIADLEITIAQQREQSANKQKELADTTKGLQEQEKARLQSVADFRSSLEASALDEAKAREEEELRLMKEANIKKLDELKVEGEEREELLLAIEEDYQRKKADLQKKYDQEEINRQLALLDKKMENLDMASLEDVNKARELFDEKLNLELSNLNLTEEEKAEIKNKYAKIQEQIDKDVANAQIDASLGALQALATIGGEESGLAKASGIAIALINAYRAISETLAAKSILPEPFGSIAKGVSAAAIGVNAFKQVRSIAGIDTNGPKSQAAAVKGKVQRLSTGGIVTGEGTGTSDSIPTMLSNGEAVINARSTAAFLPLLSNINRLGGGVGFDTSSLNSSAPTSNDYTPVIKTYVVSSDVSSQQELDRQIKSRSVV